MSSQMALILGYGFILWLLRKDLQWRKAGSPALLIPAAWIAIQGSRPLSYWFGSKGGSDANPIDTIAFAGLIGSAAVVLYKRRFVWGAFIRRNQALCLIYFYLALSALWSEMPLISLKRLFKDFGSIVVGLVFLTQVNPAAAIRTIFVRVAYILYPLSVVFIKFFPDIGRHQNRAGENMFIGVTTHKNTLGEVLFVFGLIILWDLFELYRSENRPGKKNQFLMRLGIFLIGLWLLLTCDSKTSVLCLIIGVVTFLGITRLVRMANGKQILITCLTVLIALITLDKTLNLSEIVIRALGRNPDLTGRTNIWQMVLDQKTDPLLGTGFYTFWDSDKGQAIIESYMRINSTHNGYLEMYVDGGIVGDVFLVLLLLVTGKRAINRVFSGSPLGIPNVVFWLLAIIYNFSETSFFRLDPLWFVFLLTLADYPVKSSPKPQAKNVPPEPEPVSEPEVSARPA